MKNTTLKVGFITLLFLGFIANNLIAQTTLVTKEDGWIYLDNGSDQGTAWVDSGFNDASWSTGSGIFGKDNITGATQTTVLNKHITTYFRKEFTLINPIFTDLQFNLLCDDGAIVYLNGKEVFRDNMPTGTVSYTTTASSTINGSNEGDYDLFSFTDSFLINGINTIAVELHDVKSVSIDDMAFDLELIAEDLTMYFLNKRDSWKYLDDGSDQGTAWIDSGFNHSGWDSNDAIFGFGYIQGQSINTTVSYGPYPTDVHRTTYFIKEITLTNPNYTSLDINLLCDDGAAIYINGKLAATYNMPQTWNYRTLASSVLSNADEGYYKFYNVIDTFLINGVNTFAVEIHQGRSASSDLCFDMSIEGRTERVVSGTVFMDLSGDGLNNSSSNYLGSGAIEVVIYNDEDSNGIYTNDEIINSVLTNADGSYTLKVDRNVKHLVAKLMTEDFHSSSQFTTDTVIVRTLNVNNGDAEEINFGYIGPSSLCFVMASNSNSLDKFYLVNQLTGKNQYISIVDSINGITAIEGIAIKSGMDTVWAADGGQLGWINPLTGEFHGIGTGIGYGYYYNPNRRGMVIADIDGMAYDPTTKRLYGVNRVNGDDDLLVVINPTTGRFVEDFFGNDHDFAPIVGLGIMANVYDITFHPHTGKMVGTNLTATGDSIRYIEIDPLTGGASVIATSGVGDYEGISFTNEGNLYGITGNTYASGYADNSFYSINTSNANGTYKEFINSGGFDPEACDCLTGGSLNVISGVVFYDNDSSGTYSEAIDSAYGGFKVYLFRDVDSNGIITSDDIIIDSTITKSGTGFYVFTTDSLGYFLTRPVIKGSVFDAMKTTTSEYMTEEAYFPVLGMYDGNNDFGFHHFNGVPYLPVDFLSITAEWLDQDALIKWSTASEINSNRFELQRQVDNKAFETVLTIGAAGNSTTQQDYTVIDVEADQLNASYLYYRIKQFDFDGRFTYSSIAPLRINRDEIILAYPNPVGDYVNIKLNYVGKYEVSLLDLRGREIIKLQGINEDDQTPIRVEGLTSLRKGLYFVKINHHNEESTIRIIK
jgi:hypothetical protein